MSLLAFSDFHLAFWTIGVGCVCGVACALLGCFLVLKRMSLLCDAVGHGMLPGIAIVVLLTGTLSSFVLFVGAMVFGVLTAFLAQSLSRFGTVSEDSALGIVFTSLFAVGVILLSRFLGHIDLDPGCVFYGLFEFVPTKTFTLFQVEIPETFPPALRELVAALVEVPEAFPTMLTALVITIAFVALFWKELQLAAFDPELASAMGYNAQLLHYLLVALVAACSVAAFEAVGAVVVLAMFIVPAATAQMLADRMRPMLLWAAAVAVVAAVVGYWLASPWTFACNVGGMIATVLGAELLLAALFAPRHGVLAKLVRNFRLTLRIAGEEILAILYRARENQTRIDTFVLKDHGLSRLTIWLALVRLQRQGAIVRYATGWQLTDTGAQQAESLVRAHRLWEAFLGENFELPLDHLHAPASRVEHFLGPELQKQLAEQLHEPSKDPHGKQIPPASGPQMHADERR